jgi:hypothetical protein
MPKGSSKTTVKGTPPSTNNQGTSPRPFIIPVAFPNAITSIFNDARNYAFAPNRYQRHEGIDFAPPRGYSGDLPVVSAANGRVVDVRNDPRGYGNYVVVQHENNLQTLYAHLSNVMVRVGDTLSQGQRLGTAGNTGNSSGTHLHFDVIDTTRARGNYVYGGVVDPANFLVGLGNTARSILTNTTPKNSKPTAPIRARNQRPNYQQDPISTPTNPPVFQSNTPGITDAMLAEINQTSLPGNVGLSTPIQSSNDIADAQATLTENAVPNGAGNIELVPADFLDNIKQQISDVAPYVIVLILTLIVAGISAYKFIKE